MKKLFKALKTFFTTNVGMKLLALALGVLTVLFINI